MSLKGTSVRRRGYRSFISTDHVRSVGAFPLLPAARSPTIEWDCLWARPLICASALLFLATSAGSAASKAKPTVTPGPPADPLQRLIVAVNTGDLAAVEGIAEEGKKTGAKGLPLRLLAGNGFFNPGEPQRALEEHRVALKDPAKVSWRPRRTTTAGTKEWLY